MLIHNTNIRIDTNYTNNTNKELVFISMIRIN